MILAAAALLQAAAAAGFAPPLDVPLRVVIDRSQQDVRYHAERLVRFRRDGAGYVADVRILAVRADGAAGAEAMFARAYSGLAGYTIRFRVDRAGKVTGIDDLAGVWRRFCKGMAALATDDAARQTAVVAPLAALPETQRRSILASLVEELIPAERSEEPGRLRPVRIPASSPYRAPIDLTGMHGIVVEDGLLRGTTRAQGDSGESHVELVVARDIDARTGLLVRSSDMLRTRTGSAASERWTTETVTPEPGLAWPADDPVL